MKSLFKCNCFVVGSKVENALSSLLLIWLCVNSAWIVINFPSLFFIFRNVAAFDRVCFLHRLHSDISVASKTLFFLVSFFFFQLQNTGKKIPIQGEESYCVLAGTCLCTVEKVSVPWNIFEMNASLKTTVSPILNLCHVWFKT